MYDYVNELIQKHKRLRKLNNQSYTNNKNKSTVKKTFAENNRIKRVIHV